MPPCVASLFPHTVLTCFLQDVSGGRTGATNTVSSDVSEYSIFGRKWWSHRCDHLDPWGVSKAIKFSQGLLP